MVQFELASVGQLIGRKVTWTQGNCVLTGKIVGLHGKNGLVRVRFTHGVPGQAIGTTVELAN
ncbi:MAG: 50S ribosomal protein L35ae [Candidatus Bathyarchaeota archaeon]|nr:50S ribosomal protein L35ae [Candidatus Bathyarchaeota archaeon]